jgi:dolichol-phosphate mannosyltransferase
VKIVFVIPAYNEERNLERLFERLRSTMSASRHPWEIIVVDDGSQDASSQMVKDEANNNPIHLVSHEVNLGPGAAFRSGLAKALEVAEDYDIIITKEADNTGDYYLIEPMIEKIRCGYDVVLASCYAEGGGIEGTTWDRRVLSVVANYLLRALFSMSGVRTYSSFYRAYNAGALRQALTFYGDSFIEESGFACMVEMLINLHRMGLNIVELPMVLSCDGRVDESKMKRFRTTAGFLRVMGKKFFLQRRRPGEESPKQRP